MPAVPSAIEPVVIVPYSEIDSDFNAPEGVKFQERPALEPRVHAQAEPEGAAVGGAGADIDGARLIALNMALNGESRSDTERYLAENFEIPDRLKLIDEVYAAIEG